MHANKAAKVSLPRRLAAMLYDGLLLVALLLVCATPLPLLPEYWRSGDPGHWLIRAYILIISFLFFGWFWVHGGQTLGMRAWRLRVLTNDGTGLSWRHAAIRFATAILAWLPAALGFFWSLVDREGLAWHDRWSQTRLVLVPKRAATGANHGTPLAESEN